MRRAALKQLIKLSRQKGDKEFFLKIKKAIKEKAAINQKKIEDVNKKLRERGKK